MSAPNLDAPITIDQLHVFLTVVEEGSFSKAARRLRRVQSAVSYAIANLERLLEVELFDRGGRVPVLTDAGRALLPDARAVVERMDRLHARARAIAGGVEPRLSIAIDMLFPMRALLDGLEEFTQRFPLVELVLRTEALGAVQALVQGGACQLGICTDLELPREITAEPLAMIEMVPVAGPASTLVQAEIGMEDLRDALQIVITDRSEVTAGEDRNVWSERTWRIADLDAKRDLLLSGFGWGFMPVHRVEEDLAAGRLARVRIAGAGPTEVHLRAIYRTADPPGPAGRWLLDRLARCAPRTPRKAKKPS
jgi:DNA-binding transcriptional LysR family regulator